VSKPRAPRIGRPPVPKKLAKASLLSVRFADGERRLIEEAAEREGVGLSEWARRNLLYCASKTVTPPRA
jgi:hypothetical protein